MQVYGKGVVSNGVLNRIMSALVRKLKFFVLDRTTGVGQVNRAIDQRGDAGSGMYVRTPSC